jgi:hypothetical protein
VRLFFLVSLFCLLLAAASLRAQTLATRSLVGEAYARERREEAVKHPAPVLASTSFLLNTAPLALATAEPLLKLLFRLTPGKS